MNASRFIRMLTMAMLIIAVGLPSVSHAQSPFRLKRTKKETVPINVTLLAGLNGISEPSEFYQDRFENTNLTTIGGFATGLQAMIELDTLLTQVWIGGEVTYSRMYKRALYDDPGVYYIGEPGKPVDAIESLWAIGANAFIAIGPVWKFMLLIGGGTQYHDAAVDKDLPITGTLTNDRFIPVGMAALNITLLEYDHGSIDAQFRGIKGIGDYGSVQLQSMLAFTFAF
jgi:hypothetical protein